MFFIIYNVKKIVIFYNYEQQAKMSSDFLTFGSLLVQQERIMNETKDAFKRIIENVMEPILDILKNEYREKMGVELPIHMIDEMKIKFRGTYFENTLIETETTKHSNVPRRFMNDYFSICVYPHHLMNGITTQEQLNELRQNPEFLKYAEYYQNMEMRDLIQEKIHEITRPYHTVFLPIYQTYIDFMRRGDEIAKRLDENLILSTMETIARK